MNGNYYTLERKSCIKYKCNVKQEIAKQNAITLIALIITIIILLILAGVTINVILGENGLFSLTKNTGEDYIKAGLKEELEAEILNIQGRKIAEGKELKREDLVELENINAIMDSYGIPAEGEYKNYFFEVDEKYSVTILDKLDGKLREPKIRITDVTPLGFTVIISHNSATVDEYKYYANGELVYSGTKEKRYKVNAMEGTQYSVYVEACTKTENKRSNIATATTTTINKGIRLNGGTDIRTNLLQKDIYENASGQYTVAMRVKINRKEQSTVNYMGFFGFHNDTSGMQIQFSATSTSLADGLDYSPYYDKWTDVILTYTNGERKLYLNGKLEKSRVVLRPPHPGKFVIGNSIEPNWSRFMKGSIASVKVWSKTLTDEEVANLDMGQANTSIQVENLKLESFLDNLEEIQRIGTMYGSNYTFLSN